MSVPDSLNSRIALAKAWTVKREPALDLRGEVIVWKGQELYKDSWYDSEGHYRGHDPPDWVGTLKGVAELMRELNEHEKAKGGWLANFRWGWRWVPEKSAYLCHKADGGGTWEHPLCYSPEDHPFDCIGAAWLSVFGKESDG